MHAVGGAHPDKGGSPAAFSHLHMAYERLCSRSHPSDPHLPTHGASGVISPDEQNQPDGISEEQYWEQQHITATDAQDRGSQALLQGMKISALTCAGAAELRHVAAGVNVAALL